jgi:ubiquinone/menaquinone biosynthesis C-methylase UbiE
MTAPDPTSPEFWDKTVANYVEQAHPFTGWFGERVVAALGVGPGMSVLDVATGVGAAALAAANTGAEVTAIDFSSGMIAAVAALDLPNVTARQMDGQALDLPDAAFDVSISVFGVMLFPDYRAGLSEMARVTKPGGKAGVAVWKSSNGAGTSLLLANIFTELFPDVECPAPFSSMTELADPERLAAAMVEAGFRNPVVSEATHDFLLRVSALEAVERMFEMSPHWSVFTAEQRAMSLVEMRRRLETDRVGDVLPIPSTALIVTVDR